MSALGTSKFQLLLNEDGYIFAKFPIGKNEISKVVHNSGFKQHDFAFGELTCQLVGGGVINYIGSITFNWQGMAAGAAIDENI